MQHLLLLGAGFSRNWGGWLADEAFEYLLGCPEILVNRRLSELLWRHRAGDGFEGAVAEVQRDWIKDPHKHLNNLRDLQAAVGRMFRDMNDGYINIPFEFQRDLASASRSVKTFLARFDAIFTLNQDLLLERHYCVGMELAHPEKWIGCEFPGMRHQPSNENPGDYSWAACRWSPLGATEYRISKKCQPIFKLHGSSNWIEDHGEPLMIIGGDKARTIGNQTVLSRYSEAFAQRLAEPDTKLMVIGYGFRDEHINEVLIRELNRGLQAFVISPQGAGAARAVSPTLRGQVTARSNLEHAFENGLIGASRRGLRDIFGGDDLEFNKVMRFFA